MPLFEVISPLPVDIESLSEQVRQPFLNAIDSPDPNDWEYRLTVNPQNQDTVRVSFSCGEDEYHTGQIFSPSREQINLAASLTQRLTTLPTTVEAWPHTTFLLRDQPQEKPSPPNKETNYNSQAIIDTTLSPQAPESVITTLRDIQEMVAITLGHDSANTIGFKINHADNAQTDISLEIHLPDANPDSFDPEVRQYLAQAAMYLLQTSTHPQLSATVWVMPGKSVTIPT